MSVFGVSGQAAVPAPSFNRFFKLFFWMRCHAGRIPIVNRVKIRGPKGGVGTKDEFKGRRGGRKGGSTPFLSGEGRVKKCDTSRWFFGGDPSMFGAWTFWTPDVFFSFFLYFCDITMFRAKKDSSYKHPDFYANLIHPLPLPWAYNDFTAKRQHKNTTHELP
jgi:hypothetical protein